MAAIQRPLRGSRISTFYPVKNLPSLASLDSAFQLQEYISLLIRFDVHDVDRIVTLPGSSSKDKEREEHTGISKDAEVTVDEACWIYEQLRRLAQDLSHPLITTLQQECTRASCPEMKAGEWLYLCVAHGNDGAMEQCCAIDYILHTVDSATALLNSPRTFPSRLQIPQTSHRHFSSLARRLGRIFAHAYFHHREAFEQAEAESSLYARFLALTSKFDLVPSEFLVIPSSQFSGEDGSDEDIPRGYAEGRQHYPPQLHEEDHRRFEQNQREASASTAPPNPEGSNSGSEESPTGAPKARITRPRTDTMIFTDTEANAVTDELTSRRIEREDEHEAPSTARPTMPSDVESQFEVVFDVENNREENKIDGADPIYEAEVPLANPENSEGVVESSFKEVPVTPSTQAPEATTAEAETNAETEATATTPFPEVSSAPEPTPEVKEPSPSASMPVEEAVAVQAVETSSTAETEHALTSLIDTIPEDPADAATVEQEQTSFSEAIKAGAELDTVTASMSAADIGSAEGDESTAASGGDQAIEATSQGTPAPVEVSATGEPASKVTAVVEEPPKEAPADS